MADAREDSVLEQLGGISGLIYSTLPVLVFVPVNAATNLTVAIWTALAVAAVILVVRLIRRSALQPAVSGFLGVGICAFIAHRTGDAKGFFLFGIYTSLVYGGVFLASILLRWPLVGVVWGFLNGTGSTDRSGGRRSAPWRRNRVALRAYDIATGAWVLVFAARYVVQSQLYDSDRTGWLAVARIAMGWPLAALALLVTVWAVRRADAAIGSVTEPEIEPDTEPASGQAERDA